MEKITSFLRVKKKRAAHESKADVSYSPLKSIHGAGSPIKRARTALLSPEQPDEHVPMFIHKTVKYVRQGESHPISRKDLDILKYITAHFIVPEDLEQNHKFGPLSGLTYEARVMRAYTLGLLAPRHLDTASALQLICTTCAALGHAYQTCPQGF